MIAALCLSAALAVPTAVAARLSVRRLSAGEDDLGWAWAVLPAFLGALALLAASGADALSLEGLVLAGLGALLMALAATDRQTAWAPDALTFPLAGLAGIQLAFSLGMPAAAGFGLGLGLFFALQLAYAGLSRRIGAVPPPPDLLAFALGPALLGFGVHFALALLGIAALLVAARMIPQARGLFHRPDAAEKAARDLGYEPEMGPALPLLALMMPVYLVTLAALLGYPGFLM